MMPGPRSGREGGRRSGPEKLGSAPRSTSSISTLYLHKNEVLEKSNTRFPAPPTIEDVERGAELMFRGRFADPASSSNFVFKRPNFGLRQTDRQTDEQTQ